MSRFSGKTTTELFNIFHDDYKEEIREYAVSTLHLDENDPDTHWAAQFRRISGVSKTQTDDCYWRNTEITNNEEANKKLAAYLDELDYWLCTKEDNYEFQNNI